MEKEFMSVREVAQKLSMDRKTIYRMVWAGKLEATRIGKSLRIPITAVDRMIEENKKTVVKRQ